VACVVRYAFSPGDLIPNPIPVLGYLDEFVLVLLGVALAVRMIPPVVLAECRQKARTVVAEGRPVNRVAAWVVLAAWVLLAGLAAYLLWGMAR
jgi:uncharacterized membrane protein YkvA (DUF1232 family)